MIDNRTRAQEKRNPSNLSSPGKTMRQPMLSSPGNLLTLAISLIIILGTLPIKTFSQDLSQDLSQTTPDKPIDEPTISVTKSNIIDGLTYADTCLYMLESTRQTDQPDCDTLLEWHKHQFPALPSAAGLQDSERPRFTRNLKLYHSTLRTVRKILDSEVTRQ